MLECGSAALLDHITLRRVEEGTGNVLQTISCGYNRITETGKCIKKRDLSGLMDGMSSIDGTCWIHFC